VFESEKGFRGVHLLVCLSLGGKKSKGKREGVVFEGLCYSSSQHLQTRRLSNREGNNGPRKETGLEGGVKMG